ncbi:histidine ammonia-lyase [candidate division KSB1 bacterium]|nr:histidine ammonia-lyase [candidate division KSB1 bacterium]
MVVDGHSLTPEAVAAVAAGEPAALSPTAAEQMLPACKWIEKLGAAADAAPAVYGINTGFGSLKSERFSISEARRVSRNLIVSHCAGVGHPLPPKIVRAAMLLRANALAQGYSGIRPRVIETILEMLNRGVIPIVPAQGSLGASGDLAPLSHIAIVLSRDPDRDTEEDSGEAWYQGVRMSGYQAMHKAGIERVVLEAKEGLALNNGVQIMTAIALLTLLRAEALLKAHDIALALHIEATCGVRTAFDPRIAKLRPHTGHATVANNLLALLQGSELADSDPQRVQDAYSIRCAPQIAGAARDGLAHVRCAIETEINSVTDNPLVFADAGEVLSGGNFHGDPIGLPVDYMKILLCELGNLSERRVSRLMDRHLNFGLTPYLARKPGVESGFMIASYTASALVAESKVLAHPASIDTIPTSENQEDIVSMGTHGARQAMQILENIERVVAIELLCAAQAVDLRKENVPHAMLGRGSQAAHEFLRKSIPVLTRDRVLAGDMEKAIELVRDGELLAAVSAAVPLE